MDVMLDLETLGTGSNAAIVSIGAVKFAPEIGVVYDDKFYSADFIPGDMDISTIRWWMQQNDAAREVFKARQPPIFDVLGKFALWFTGSENLWGNGASFDNVILGNAYTSRGMKVPWSHSKNRCYRTMIALAPDIPLERIGTHHNALADAVTQAHHLVKVYKALGLNKLENRQVDAGNAGL